MEGLMKISDEQLLSQTSKLVRQERKILKQLLDHLAEIQRRRLFCELGYSTLFKYLVHSLGYSEGGAARRINALKLIQKVPETIKMIEKGELNLTNAGLLYKFHKQKHDVRSILDKVKNKSSDECEKILYSKGLNIEKKKTIIKNISKNEKRVHITLKNQTLKRLNRLCAMEKKELNELIDQLSIEKLMQCLTGMNVKGSRGVPTALKRNIFLRANFQCEHVGCNEYKGLEIEHVNPVAKGGSHDPCNLKVFCKSHNQRSAIKIFGQKKMDLFLN